MMNEKQIEIAAKHLCRLHGIDPDEKVASFDAARIYNDWIPGMAVILFRWELFAIKIRDHMKMDKAINEALNNA